MTILEQMDQLVLDAERQGVKGEDVVQIKIPAVRDKGGGFVKLTFDEFKDIVLHAR